MPVKVTERGERFAKFNLVGLLGAVLQLLLWCLLVKSFHLREVAATPIAAESVVLHNFAWHERFTWRRQESGARRQRVNRLWRFHISNGLISIGGNAALTYILIEQLKAPGLMSAAAAIVLCAPVNFLLADLSV